jgi:hypothetical protein
LKVIDPKSVVCLFFLARFVLSICPNVTTITHTLKYLTKSIHIGSYLPVATGTGGCLSLINRRIKKSTKGIHTSNNNTNWKEKTKNITLWKMW